MTLAGATRQENKHKLLLICSKLAPLFRSLEHGDLLILCKSSSATRSPQRISFVRALICWRRPHERAAIRLRHSVLHPDRPANFRFGSILVPSCRRSQWSGRIHLLLSTRTIGAPCAQTAECSPAPVRAAQTVAPLTCVLADSSQSPA